MNGFKLCKKFVISSFPFMLFLLCINIISGFFRGFGATYIEKITAAVSTGVFADVYEPVAIGASMLIAAYATRWLSAVLSVSFSQKLAAHLRCRLTMHLGMIDFKTYESYSTGELQSIVRNDVDSASQIIFAIFSDILNNVFVFAFSLYYMFQIDSRMAFILTLVIFAVYGVNQILLIVLKKHELRTRESIGKSTEAAERFFHAFSTIKAFSAAGFALRLFKREKERYNKNTMNFEKIDSVRYALFSFISNVCLYIAVIYFGYKGMKGEIEINQVLVFIALLRQLIIPMEFIFRSMSQIVKSKAAWDRVSAILSHPQKDEPDVQLSGANKIEIRDLNFGHTEDEQILKDVYLELLPGKIVELSGESGSGKTTLFKIILGLYTPWSAQYFESGKKADVKNLKGMCAFSSLENQIFNLSIYENIRLDNDSIKREDCFALAKELGVYEWLSSLEGGLDYVITQNAGNLSVGQRQTIINMRALLAKKSIIILDEPFSALDVVREKHLRGHLESIKNEYIILLSSHRK